MKPHNPAPFELIHLDESDAGSVLERAIKKRRSDWSWGAVRESIRRRKVQVNGNLCLDPVRKVTAKDVIKLWSESLPKPIEATDIRIAYVDEFLVVVEKPAGITSVRHFEERNLSEKRRQLQPTLEELVPLALLHHFKSITKPRDYEDPNQKRTKRIPVSPRELKDIRSEDRKNLEHKLKRFQVIAVHRLDRDTSGLMLFARTPSVAQSLIEAFKHHRVVRKYHAVVHGHPNQQTFDSILVRDRGDGHRGSKPADSQTTDPTEQHAITHIRPIERIGPYSLIECQLETGRTHQIRIHLSEAGHVLCGDAIYCKLASGSVIQDTSGAPRQALHSATLAFDHPISNEKLEFKMPWPADLHRWLTKLKQASCG
jgi:23S rRNA pseudouridine1911/1915/1917 synthase